VHVKHLIIGAGPTGLGAAYRLNELGEHDWLILDRNDYVGGLAASFKDSAGFTWDIGGHVVFSHYDYFDRLVEKALGDKYLTHKRISKVRMASNWVPYPFQNNIRHLPRELCWECVQGLIPGNRPEADPSNFKEWIERVFGPGIARLFMLPYNFKVWATPPEHMSYQWTGERVSIVDLEQTLKNLILEQKDEAWGPNSMFRFPLHGGTGEIFRRLAQPLEDQILTGREVWKVDAAHKTLLTRQGETITYDHLLTTVPLDQMVGEMLANCPDTVRKAAKQLKHNSVYVAGVGVDGMRQDDTCWMYFPEDHAPFYRLTNFHNYSPNNAAKPGESRAFMAETSFSEHKSEALPGLMDRTVDGLVRTGMMNAEDQGRILSRWEYTADYGYPVPTLGRDKALDTIQPFLESMDIYSRGRFGGWKYEAANMDHSVMQGVEWANRMIRDEAETTYGFNRKGQTLHVRRAA
jgi:protoporphyrinogen oxidase